MLFVIDLEFFGGIKKIVPYHFGDEGDESEFRYLEKCDHDKNDKHKDR